MLASCEVSNEPQSENPTTIKTDTNIEHDSTEPQLTLNNEYFNELSADTTTSYLDNVKIVAYHYFFKRKSYDEKLY